MKYIIEVPDDMEYALLTGATDRGYYSQEIEFANLEKPEPHWIPVTERLPETDMYRTLTTIRTPHKGTNVRSGHFYKGFFFNDNGDTWNATDKEVLAWMPLPEPYKGVTE